MSFCGLTTHFFLVLNIVSLSGCNTVYHSPTEGCLGGLQVWEITNKTINIFVWIYVLKSFEKKDSFHKSFLKYYCLGEDNGQERNTKSLRCWLAMVTGTLTSLGDLMYILVIYSTNKLWIILCHKPLVSIKNSYSPTWGL